MIGGTLGPINFRVSPHSGCRRSLIPRISGHRHHVSLASRSTPPASCLQVAASLPRHYRSLPRSLPVTTEVHYQDCGPRHPPPPSAPQAAPQAPCKPPRQKIKKMTTALAAQLAVRHGSVRLADPRNCCLRSWQLSSFFGQHSTILELDFCPAV